MRLLPCVIRRNLILLLLLLPLLTAHGQTALRKTQRQSQTGRPIEETTPASAAADVSTTTTTTAEGPHVAEIQAADEADKFALPGTQSLSEQDPAILGGDPNSHFLINFGHNAMANGVRKHHPKTYDEVASLVRSVKAAGGRLRPMGALHSWSNIFPEDNTDVLFLDQLKGLSQDPHDYARVTIQAGVMQSELADWADSKERGYGRFSYLSQATVVTGVTFVGACQTASHGSGFVGESTPDSIIEVTLVDHEGNIKHYSEGDPRIKILAACLGMCGIILDVTVRFNPSTDAVQVTRGRRPLHSLLPPRSVAINESFNPLKDFIEGEGYHGGALSYAPYNSAPEVGIKLEASKIDEYHSKDRIWSNSVQKLPPGTAPRPHRDGILFGTQTEPYYDKDAFYPLDYATLVIGSRVPHMVVGEDRFHKSQHFNPYLANYLSASVNYLGNPTGIYSGFRYFNTSRAHSQHLVKYLANVAPESDFEFAFRIEDDYANVYEAQRVLIEENDWMFRNRGCLPLSMFSGLRWTEASSCPLSHVYGKPGEKFALMECIATQGTDGWDEYVQRVFARWSQMRSKKDGSLPKPHWAKWDSRWVPGLLDYIKKVYADQIDMIRPVVLENDPSGLFRNSFLSDLFRLPGGHQ